jgi:hypothetical protein
MQYLFHARRIKVEWHVFKKFFIIATTLLFGNWISGFSQLPNEIKISGNYRNVAISSFLDELENKYGVKIFYNPDLLKDKVLNQIFENTLLTTALEKALNETSLLFVVVQPGSIVIMPKEAVATAIGKIDSRTTGTDNLIIIGKPEDISKVKHPEIKGTILDGKTGEPIIGATILIKELANGTATNIKGSFQFNLSPGIYTIVVASVGYEEKKINIKVIGNGTLNAELFEKSIKLDEVIISAQKADRNVRSNQISLVELDRKALKQLPSVFGEKDIIKSFTMMPGVKSVGEFGSGINVRGGSNDQNLFLIEGVPIFNTAHVMGLLTSINPDAVSSATLSKGYIPPSFGERVASVMDIQLKEGNFKEFHASGGVGVLDSRLMFEGPIIENKLTFIVGGRASYSDWLLKQMPDINLQQSSAKFYDFNAMMNYIVDSKNKLSLFGYASKDQLKYGNELNYGYGNYLGSFIWAHNFDRNFNFNLILAYSNYLVGKDDLSNEFLKNRINTGIIYKSVKWNFTYSAIAKNTIDFGIQGIGYLNNPGNRGPLGTKSIIAPYKLDSENAYETSIYLGDKFELNDIISINAGFRYTGYFLVGPYQINNYKQGASLSEQSIISTTNYKNGKLADKYLNLEPRGSIKILLNDESSLKISYNRNYQYLSLISYTSITTPDDIWKLSNRYLKPIECNQYALGFFRNFKKNTIEASVEVYYKDLKNLVDYKNGAQLSMNPELETALVNAEGKNYGIEFFVKKNSGKLDGWISYTYSRSLRRTQNPYPEETINNGNYYNSSFDKPHDFTISTTYHFNRRIRFAGTFNYASGRAVTLPELEYFVSDNWVIKYSDRNKYRLPDYHRLDLSISIDESLRIKKLWKGSWTFSIINVYARKNAFSVFFKRTDNFGNDTRMFGLYKLYIIGQPLPTLTYNFTF